MTYNPVLSRWMEADPTGPEYVDGMNLYQADDSNPINRTDPTGLISTAPEDAILNEVDGENARICAQMDKENSPPPQPDPAGTRGRDMVVVHYSRLAHGPAHSYIVFTHSDGTQIYYRAGPSDPTVAIGTMATTGLGGGIAGATLVPSSPKAGAASGAAVGTGIGLVGAPEGAWGQILVTSGAYVSGSDDWDPNSWTSVVFDKPGSVANDAAIRAMEAEIEKFADDVNSTKIPYMPAGLNSNSFIHQAIGKMGLTAPNPPIVTPGFGYDLLPYKPMTGVEAADLADQLRGRL